MVMLDKWRKKMFPEPTDEEVIAEAEMIVKEINFYLQISGNKKSSAIENSISIERLKQKIKWI